MNSAADQSGFREPSGVEPIAAVRGSRAASSRAISSAVGGRIVSTPTLDLPPWESVQSSAPMSSRPPAGARGPGREREVCTRESGFAPESSYPPIIRGLSFTSKTLRFEDRASAFARTRPPGPETWYVPSLSSHVKEYQVSSAPDNVTRNAEGRSSERSVFQPKLKPLVPIYTGHL